MNLREISEIHGHGKGLVGGDKCVRHNYCEKYERHLQTWRDKKFKLLEIGVMEGRSLKMWKDYFPRADIIGIDILEDCKKYESERIQVEIGSQADKSFLQNLCDKYGTFEIIIDDGSHLWNDIISSFNFLFPRLAGGGHYVIEDLHTSYDREFSQGAKQSAIDYLKSTIDKINLNGSIGGKYDKSAAIKQKIVYEKSLHLEDCRYEAYGLHFYTSICFIEKEKNKTKRNIKIM